MHCAWKNRLIYSIHGMPTLKNNIHPQNNFFFVTQFFRKQHFLRKTIFSHKSYFYANKFFFSQTTFLSQTSFSFRQQVYRANTSEIIMQLFSPWKTCCRREWWRENVEKAQLFPHRMNKICKWSSFFYVTQLKPKHKPWN